MHNPASKMDAAHGACHGRNQRQWPVLRGERPVHRLKPPDQVYHIASCVISTSRFAKMRAAGEWSCLVNKASSRSRLEKRATAVFFHWQRWPPALLPKKRYKKRLAKCQVRRRTRFFKLAAVRPFFATTLFVRPRFEFGVNSFHFVEKRIYFFAC